jgi:cytoskeletal protein RodZ
LVASNDAALLLNRLRRLAGSEDALLLEDVLRLTQLLLLELAPRLLERELKPPLVDAAVEVAPSSESVSERSSRSADAEQRLRGRSLPPEKTSSATHTSAASSPASASPPDDSTQNSKSSAAGEASVISVMSCPAADRAAPVVGVERGTGQAIAGSCYRSLVSCYSDTDHREAGAASGNY